MLFSGQVDKLALNLIEGTAAAVGPCIFRNAKELS